MELKCVVTAVSNWGNTVHEFASPSRFMNWTVVSLTLLSKRQSKPIHKFQCIHLALVKLPMQWRHFSFLAASMSNVKKLRPSQEACCMTWTIGDLSKEGDQFLNNCTIVTWRVWFHVLHARKFKWLFILNHVILNWVSFGAIHQAKLTTLV